MCETILILSIISINTISQFVLLFFPPVTIPLNLLVLLQPLIRLPVLPQAIATLVSRTWCATGAALRAIAGCGATSLATLLARLDRIDFSMSKLARPDALVGLSVFAEAVVFCWGRRVSGC